MDLKLFIGFGEFFIARAHTRIYRSIALVSFCLVITSTFSVAQEIPFIRGNDSRIHGVQLNHTGETATRKKMRISTKCGWIKPQATAVALIGSEGSVIIPHIKAKRGIVILEGISPDAEPKVMDTELLGNYKNYPASIPAETAMLPSRQYPLAITLTASMIGQGDLVIQKGDSITVNADHQLYAYALPEITIPSEGILRLYLGSDDTFYYDAALTHPAHAGACGRKK